jgi:hypothetical protein
MSRAAAAQHGSSVSLTHTVSVTVPPRVKVQVTGAALTVQRAGLVASSQTTIDGLALSVSATQPWTLSIASAAGKSRLQWSRDRSAGFAAVSTREATVASGELSQIPTASNVFFRNAISMESHDRSTASESDSVMLTVVAP